MGVCRLYPQQQNKHESDWCGQHEAKAVKMPPMYDITTDQMTAPKRKYVRKANAEASA
jgi:hypothetical protein